MSAICPICGWKLPLLHKRPKNAQIFECPSCGSSLKFCTILPALRPVIFGGFFTLIILVRVVESEQNIFMMLAIALSLALGILILKFERFERYCQGKRP